MKRLSQNQRIAQSLKAHKILMDWHRTTNGMSRGETSTRAYNLIAGRSPSQLVATVKDWTGQTIQAAASQAGPPRDQPSLPRNHSNRRHKTMNTKSTLIDQDDLTAILKAFFIDLREELDDRAQGGDVGCDESAALQQVSGAIRNLSIEWYVVNFCNGRDDRAETSK